MTKQYYLYRDDDKKVVSVVPMGDGTNNVNNFTGAYFGQHEKIMTDEELLHFKSVHNLFYEQELGSQLNIWDVF